MAKILYDFDQNTCQSEKLKYIFYQKYMYLKKIKNKSMIENSFYQIPIAHVRDVAFLPNNE